MLFIFLSLSLSVDRKEVQTAVYAPLDRSFLLLTFIATFIARICLMRISVPSSFLNQRRLIRLEPGTILKFGRPSILILSPYVYGYGVLLVEIS